MSKAEKYLNNRKKSNRRFVTMVIFILLVSFFAFKYINSTIASKKMTVNSQIDEKNQEIKEIKNDISSIRSDYKKRNTDEFKEKVAREKLGMIKDDEYVYKDNNK